MKKLTEMGYLRCGMGKEREAKGITDSQSRRIEV